MTALNFTRLIASLFILAFAAAADTAAADTSAADTSAADTSTADAARPNVIVLYADDLGYGDVQCYNPERGRIPTPHIDQLAADGMRFTDGHSSSGVCTPSRYTILTGRYHWRSRLQSGIVGLWGAPLITPDRMTIGSLAKQNGYRTACIGKWHLGWHWPIPAEKKQLFRTTGYRGRKDLQATDEHLAAWREVFSKPIPGGPTAVGFDEYFGTDVPNWPPYCFIENDRTVGIPSEYAAPELFVKNQASQQGPALKGWTLEPILPALGDRAAAFIKREAKTSEPFLLYLPFTSPHTPLSVNEPWKGKSDLNLYADFVMETDAIVGHVLQALKESGAADETLVIFTSDNGCAPYIGVSELEKKGHYPSGPLRGYKADAWEGGHRVPFIVRWPGVVEAGSVNDQLVHHADLLATFADIFGTDLSDGAGEDSFSLLPLMKGADQPMRDTSVSCSINGTPSLREGDWKYIAAPGSGGWGKGGDQSQPVQLYNLSDDLAESKNLAAAQPERLAEMQALLEKLITKGRSTPGKPQNNDVKVRRFRAAAKIPKSTTAQQTGELWQHLSSAADLAETRYVTATFLNKNGRGLLELSPVKDHRQFNAWATISPPETGWDLKLKAKVEATATNSGSESVDVVLWVVSSDGWDAVGSKAALKPGESQKLSCDLRKAFPDGTPKLDPGRIREIRVMLQHAQPGASVEIEGLVAVGSAEPWVRPKNRLDVPDMEEGKPAPGRRVRYQHPSDVGTSVYSTLYLPRDWEPGKSYPVIAEYPGNIFYHADRCWSTGRPEQCAMGYGITKGKGSIWISLPFVDREHGGIAESGFGSKAGEDTRVHALAAIEDVCANWGGDRSRLLICGFSRGSIACGFIGLANDEIGSLWKGIVGCQHYDGSKWHQSNIEGAVERAPRFQGTAIFQVDNDLDRYRPVQEATRPEVKWTWRQSGLGYHATAMFLDERPLMKELRQWYAELVGVQG